MSLIGPFPLTPHTFILIAYLKKKQKKPFICIFNRYIKLNMSKSKLLIFPPKLTLPDVFPLLIDASHAFKVLNQKTGGILDSVLSPIVLAFLQNISRSCSVFPASNITFFPPRHCYFVRGLLQ